MNKLLECTRHDKFSRPTTLTPTFSDADCELFNAAYDHALIWWAEHHSVNWKFWLSVGGNWWIENFAKGDTWRRFGSYLEADPFGFPILTDYLRAPLIAAMEGGA